MIKRKSFWTSQGSMSKGKDLRIRRPSWQVVLSREKRRPRDRYLKAYDHGTRVPSFRSVGSNGSESRPHNVSGVHELQGTSFFCRKEATAYGWFQHVSAFTNFQFKTNSKQIPNRLSEPIFRVAASAPLERKARRVSSWLHLMGSQPDFLP